jgi:hypothetical protein
MAHDQDHEIAQLASRLTSAADACRHPGAVALEKDLRSAAALLEEIEKPLPVVPKLSSELARIANACPDAATALRLRRLLGEA